MSRTTESTPVQDLVDADKSEFDSSEEYREYVDEKLAEIEASLDDHDVRLDVLDTRADALLDAVEDARSRAERAERYAKWGGLGYDDRLSQVVRTLAQRARNNPKQMSGPQGKEVLYTASICPTEVDRRPGVYELFDGAVSARTCRSYIRDLAACDGLSVREPIRGGWGGGSTQMRLCMDYEAFAEAYGADWEIEDLLADMEDDSDA
jgi:hypothetical protein